MANWHGCKAYLNGWINSYGVKCHAGDDDVDASNENGYLVLGGISYQDHPAGCMCGPGLSQEAISEWDRTKQGELCCGRGCPLERDHYIRRGYHILSPTEQIIQGQEQKETTEHEGRGEVT